MPGLRLCQAVPCRIPPPVRRSALARANERHDWRIFAECAWRLPARARDLHAGEDSGLDLDSPVFALDSSTVDLCLSLFPRAPFRTAKAAVKLHTLLDLRGSIPSFVHVSDGKLHDVNVLDLLTPEPGAVYVMDRAYVDCKRLHALQRTGAFFVVRAKKNLKWHRIHAAPKASAAGIRADRTIALDGKRTRLAYPDRLRRVHFRDAATDRKPVFLTNSFNWPAPTVRALYKSRWHVEIFFELIKRNLRIKRVLGTSENAVKSQLRVAISVYALAAIIRKQLDIPASLHSMLKIPAVMPFERANLREILLSKNSGTPEPGIPGQLQLFESTLPAGPRPPAARACRSRAGARAAADSEAGFRALQSRLQQVAREDPAQARRQRTVLPSSHSYTFSGLPKPVPKSQVTENKRLPGKALQYKIRPIL